jgi:hypothetical protein
LPSWWNYTTAVWFEGPWNWNAQYIHLHPKSYRFQKYMFPSSHPDADFLRGPYVRSTSVRVWRFWTADFLQVWSVIGNPKRGVNQRTGGKYIGMHMF